MASLPSRSRMTRVTDLSRYLHEWIKENCIEFAHTCVYTWLGKSSIETQHWHVAWFGNTTVTSPTRYFCKGNWYVFIIFQLRSFLLYVYFFLPLFNYYTYFIMGSFSLRNGEVWFLYATFLTGNKPRWTCRLGTSGCKFWHTRLLSKIRQITITLRCW